MVLQGLAVGATAIAVIQLCTAEVLQNGIPFHIAHSKTTTTTTTSESPVEGCLDQCKVIADVKLGWKDGCMGLDRIPSATDEEACRLTCCATVECEVWQYGPSGCWTGKVAHCNTNRDQTMTGGQMITHGTSEVLDENFKALCPGTKYFDINTGTTLEKRDMCRAKCLANRMCTYYQLKDLDRCFYGDHMECGAEVIPDPAVKYGARISHICRSAPGAATVAATNAPDGDGFGFGTLAIGIAALTAVSLAGVYGVIHVMHQQQTPSKRGVDFEDEEEEEEDEGDLETHESGNGHTIE